MPDAPTVRVEGEATPVTKDRPKASDLDSPGQSGSTAVSADVSVSDAPNNPNESSDAPTLPKECIQTKILKEEEQNKVCSQTSSEEKKEVLEPPVLQKDMKGKLILRGIYKKPEGTFKADIQVHGRSVYLGNYARIELACQAYDRVLIKIHGAENIRKFALPSSQRLHFALKYYNDDLDYIEKVCLERSLHVVRVVKLFLFAVAEAIDRINRRYS